MMMPQQMDAKLQAYLVACGTDLNNAFYNFMHAQIQGTSSLWGIWQFLDGRNDVSYNMKTAVYSVLQLTVNDLLDMPWSDPTNAPVFQIGQYWGLDQAQVDA